MNTPGPAEQITYSQMDKSFEDPADHRSRLAIQIIIGSIISLGLLACWYSFLAFRSQVSQFWNLTYISWLIFAASGLSLTKIVRPVPFKLFSIQGFFSLAFILTSSQIEGMGILSGITILVYALFLAASFHTGLPSGVSISIGILLAMAASLIDVFSPFSQLQAPIVGFSLIAVLFLLAGIFCFLVVRKIVVLTMRIKLVVASLIAVLIPILVISYFQVGFMSKSIINSTSQALEFAASQTAKKIDQFFTSNRQAIAQDVKLSSLINYLSLPAHERAGSLAEGRLRTAFETLPNRFQPYIISYGLIDSSGVNVFDTNPAAVGKNEASNAYFQSPLANSQTYVSSIEFSITDGAPVIYFSGPILNDQQKNIGVLRATYNAQGFQKIAEENTGLIGVRSYAVLFDEKSVRVADTLSSGFLLKSGNASFYPPFPIISATTTMKEKSWTVMYVQEQAVMAQLLRQQNQLTILIATLIAGVVSLMATVFSRFLTQPIVRLTRNAQKISDGDFNVTVPVTNRDEIGTLSYAFNLMTDRVRTSINELEARVRSRTAELETQNRALRSRTKQIQTVAEVARSIVSSQNLEKLLGQITTTISERCGFYHVGIFLLDETKEFAELRAANSEGGKRMAARRHKLSVGKEGIVGYVTATGKPRIAFDVGEDSIHFRNPDLSQTRSEMALPLIVNGEIIGALDVQSEASDAFSQDDINLFITLADQVAIAIVNSRLYQETLRSLEESQQLHRQYLRQEWTKLASETPIIGYQYSSTRVNPLFIGSINEEDDLPQADSTATVILEENGKRTTVLKIPITLRGEVIGTIDLKDDQGVSWDAEAVLTARAVADQISQALENARLFEQTQRRAERERKVLEITSRIRSTTDPESMLQIAATELQNALSARANIVSLRLTDSNNPEKIDGNGFHGGENEAQSS